MIELEKSITKFDKTYFSDIANKSSMTKYLGQVILRHADNRQHARHWSNVKNDQKKVMMSHEVSLVFIKCFASLIGTRE